MKFLMVLAAVVACSLALRAPQNSCKTNSDCEKTQCCVSNSRWLIASKRAVLGSLTKGTSGYPKLKDLFRSDAGTCVDYVKKGASCHYLGFTSCGCEPGTKCNYYPALLEKVAVKKLDTRIIGNRPGNSYCEKA